MIPAFPYREDIKVATITERFSYSRFVVHESRTSKIKKGWVHTVEVGFNCPRCDAFLSPLEHGQSTTCVNCRLEMGKLGNSLTCTIDERCL